MVDLMHYEMDGIDVHFFEKNHLNRVVYSEVKDFGFSTRNLGISIKYVVEGWEYYSVGGKNHKVGPGQFLLVNHGEDISVEIRSEQVVKGMCLFIDPNWVRQRVYETENTSGQLLDDPYPQATFGDFEFEQRVFPLVFSPLRHFIGNLVNQQAQLKTTTLEAHSFYNLAESILAQKEQLSQQKNRIKAERLSTREELSRRINVALAYIHDHLGDKLKVRDIARVAMMSEFHFLRTFKQVLGVSPISYIKQLRMQQAYLLLDSGKWSIPEVAELCGYQDLQYFTKSFKRQYGITPSAIYMSID